MLINVNGGGVVVLIFGLRDGCWLMVVGCWLLVDHLGKDGSSKVEGSSCLTEPRTRDNTDSCSVDLR